MLSFDEARSRLMQAVPRVGAERVPLADAVGRVLAQPVVAPRDLPGSSVSAMDGYAVASDDFSGTGPWRLPLRGESRAGGRPPAFLPRTACRIFTGAVVPPGADAVVMQENVRLVAGEVEFERPPARGDHIRPQGCDLPAGQRALTEGERLTPGHLALAAMLGVAELPVARRPVVTILCTGDELRLPGQALELGALYESNALAIASLARQAGAHVRVAPPVPDDLERMTATFVDALQATDVLVTIGGVSVGEHDLVKPALEQAGVALDFWKVAIKPGKPLAVGQRGPTRVLGLPGNPAASLVTFSLFGMPLLRAMQGDVRPTPPRFTARLARSVRRRPGRLEFARARLHQDDVGLRVELHDNQSSGTATSLAWADSLALLPAEAPELPEGTGVEVVRFADC